MYSLTISILVICLAAFAQVNAHEAACYKDFKNKKDIEAGIGKCLETLKLKESDIPMGPQLEKTNYDDKCFMKCLLVGMKYAKDDGSFDMKMVEEDLKKHAPEGKADALIALMKECVETTAKDATVAKDPCKSLAKTKSCFHMGQDKICSS